MNKQEPKPTRLCVAIPPGCVCNSRSILIIVEQTTDNDKFINVIMRDILNYAKKKWAKKIDIVMVGHYHQQKIINHGESSLIFLGDWLEKYTVTTINENNIWQGNWKEFIELT